MRLWKKALSVLLVSATAISMCACGGAKKGSGSSDTFKIGGIGPTTGDAAIYGKAVKNGIQLAVDEINKDGGINGKKIEYKFEDDQNDTEKSVNAYNSLKDWGMQMLVGTVTSNPCTAVVEESHNDNMFQLTPSATAVESIQYDNAFRMCFSDPNQGSASADYIADHKIATKVAVIYNSSDPYSSGIYQKFAEEAKAKKLDVVAAEAFTADSKTDFSVQIQKAQNAGAEMVFLPIYYQEASLILAQAKKAGFTPKYFGCDGMDGILSVENFDTSLAEGLMLLTPFSTTEESSKAFTEAYVAAYGIDPNQFAADSYDAIYAIKAAVEKAGVTADMSASDICDALKPAMTEISIDGLTGSDMVWNANGEPNKAPKAVKIVNGEYEMQ